MNHVMANLAKKNSSKVPRGKPRKKNQGLVIEFNACGEGSSQSGGEHKEQFGKQCWRHS